MARMWQDHEEDIKPSAHDITPVKTELDGVKNEQPNEVRRDCRIADRCDPIIHGG